MSRIIRPALALSKRTLLLDAAALVAAVVLGWSTAMAQSPAPSAPVAEPSGGASTQPCTPSMASAAVMSPAAPVPAVSPPASPAPMGSSLPVASAAPCPPAAASATVQDFEFVPASLTVTAGTTVTWTNQGPSQHTVTADDGSFDSGPVAVGGTFSQTFGTAGTFTYHCNIHQSMTGTVIVQ